MSSSSSDEPAARAIKPKTCRINIIMQKKYEFLDEMLKSKDNQQNPELRESILKVRKNLSYLEDMLTVFEDKELKGRGAIPKRKKPLKADKEEIDREIKALEVNLQEIERVWEQAAQRKAARKRRAKRSQRNGIKPQSKGYAADCSNSE